MAISLLLLSFDSYRLFKLASYNSTKGVSTLLPQQQSGRMAGRANNLSWNEIPQRKYKFPTIPHFEYPSARRKIMLLKLYNFVESRTSHPMPYVVVKVLSASASTDCLLCLDSSCLAGIKCPLPPWCLCTHGEKREREVLQCSSNFEMWSLLQVLQGAISVFSPCMRETRRTCRGKTYYFTTKQLQCIGIF